MKYEFNVIWWDSNRTHPESYNILPYLDSRYEKLSKKKRPKTFEEFKAFILGESRYMWWARCQYEIIISDWPNQAHRCKWDIYKQIEMNLDNIVYIFMSNKKV